MARPPLDRTQLDVRGTFELTHPSSTPRRPRVFRHIIGLHLGDGTIAYGCADCTNAYTARESVPRHIRRDHSSGPKLATASASPGTPRFLVSPPEPPPAGDTAAGQGESVDVGDVLQHYAGELIAERNQWRDRALSAERRLRVANDALSAPTTALPVIGGEVNDGG